MSNSMCQVGDECEVEIVDLAFGGDGVGRLDGLTVFVPYVAQGERVRIRLTEIKRKFARGVLLETLTPSAQRVAPRCAVFGRCAGCQYQHLHYDAQRSAKEDQVRNLLQRIGRIDSPPVAPLIPAPSPWQYRSRMILHGPGGPAYVAVDGCSRVPIQECPIADPALNAALKQWNEEHPQGLMAEQDLALRLDGTGNVWISEQRDTRWVMQRMAGTEFIVPLNSFFQVNPAVTEKLAATILDRIRTVGPSVLIDAYAGVGVFGLLAAPLVERVIAIESDGAACRAARKNGRELDVQNIRVIRDPVEHALPHVLPRIDPARTLCLLDPPRAGCPQEVLQQIETAGIAHLLYVSCAPDRLARDAQRLTQSGYKLTRVTPFDMFPQTGHIEVLAEFERR